MNTVLQWGKKKRILIQRTDEQITFLLLLELLTLNFQYLKKPTFPDITEIENKSILTEPNYNILENKK